MGITRTVVRRLAHPRPVIDGVGTVAVAVAHPDLDARVLTARMLQALTRYGPSHHLSSAAIDAAMGPPPSGRPPSGADGVGVEAFLDRAEATHRFVLLETDRTLTPWSTTVLRRADRVVIVAGSQPKPEEEAAVRAFVDAARSGYRQEVWLAVVHRDRDGRPAGTAELVARSGVDRVIHLRSDAGGDIARLARLAAGTGIGLVLGGGGARGFAHIGVYRALRELRVPIDAVAGASIGGVLGAGIALGLSPEELTAQAAEGFRKVLDYTLPLVSVVKGARITRGIETVFGGLDIEDLDLPFLCVSTDLTTSRQVVHHSGPATPAIRAGLAIPGVIPPVPHEGSLLVDGGVLDNLPIEALRATGLVGEVVAVDVAPPLGPRARADFGLSVSGWGALRSRFRRRRTYPQISSLLLRSMIVGSMERRDRLVAEGYADLLLAPDLRGISLLAFDRVEAVARAGYEAAVPEIEAWLVRRDEGT
jgi:predicted acylesterase/phospholipase RssA